jgi:hypothetical protein
VAITDCARQCAQAFTEATTCPDPTFDECCTSAECPDGLCYTGPFGAFCGGAFPAPSNRCLVDECQSDADCRARGFSSFCAPAGTFNWPVRTCRAAACQQNADCTEELGGLCAPVTADCCDRPAALTCVYPSGGCFSSADCDGGFCVTERGRALCSPDPPPCPP